jgi:hypothetical protein
MRKDWKESAHRVGDWVRGGSWVPGHEVAYWVGTGKVSARDFATEARLAENTILKYQATWWWAAQAGVVPHAGELLSPDMELDFSGLTQDDWAGYYKTAMVNPPPWSPNGRPLEPRTGADRHVAKSQARPTPVQTRDAILNDPALEVAAREAIREKDRHRALERAKRRGGPVPAPTIDEADDWMAAHRKARRELTELLGLTPGLPKGQEFRDMVADAVTELRNYLDAIEQLSQGESMDDELARLLEDGAR